MQNPIILMYHRVTELAVDPWGLAVAPEIFNKQLAVISDLCAPLPMIDFAHRLINGNLPTNALGVTFDDGYVDNLLIAKPILEEEKIPATVFVATGSIGSKKGYWWDELAALLLDRIEECDCEITIGGERLRLLLQPKSSAERALPNWRDWRNPRTERES